MILNLNLNMFYCLLHAHNTYSMCWRTWNYFSIEAWSNTGGAYIYNIPVHRWGVSVYLGAVVTATNSGKVDGDMTFYEYVIRLLREANVSNENLSKCTAGCLCYIHEDLSYPVMDGYDIPQGARLDFKGIRLISQDPKAIRVALRNRQPTGPDGPLYIVFQVPYDGYSCIYEMLSSISNMLKKAGVRFRERPCVYVTTSDGVCGKWHGDCRYLLAKGYQLYFSGDWDASGAVNLLPASTVEGDNVSYILKQDYDFDQCVPYYDRMHW
jgi:hypothetical protein